MAYYDLLALFLWYRNKHTNTHTHTYTHTHTKLKNGLLRLIDSTPVVPKQTHTHTQKIKKKNGLLRLIDSIPVVPKQTHKHTHTHTQN